MADTARKAFVSTARRGRRDRARARALEAEDRRRARLPRLHPTRPRCARASSAWPSTGSRGRSGVALHYLAVRRRARAAALAGRPARDRPGRPGDRRRADLAAGAEPEGEALDRDQARVLRRAAEAAAEAALGRQRRAPCRSRSGRRRSRCSSASSSSSRPRPTGSSSATRRSSFVTSLMPRKHRTQGPRHVGADRREARRVRARAAAADRLRGDGALARVLGDRRAVLAPARGLRRDRRDRARDRPARSPARSPSASA